MNHDPINIGDHSGSENGDAFNPIPVLFRDQVRWARKKAIVIARDNKKADRYFSSLPNGRSFTDLINDGTIWINYDPAISDFGYTYGNNDLWIGPSAFRIGRWTVLATLIHELAHIDGAPGGASVCSAFSAGCHAAELAVLECGLGKKSEYSSGVDDPYTPYNPNTFG